MNNFMATDEFELADEQLGAVFGGWGGFDIDVNKQIASVTQTNTAKAIGIGNAVGATQLNASSVDQDYKDIF